MSDHAYEVIAAQVAEGRYAHLQEFAKIVREASPEETDEERAQRVDESAFALRKLDLPEWTAFAALAVVLRAGPPGAGQ